MNLFKTIIIGKEDKKKIGKDCLIYGDLYTIAFAIIFKF
jgi:hypothetical protein